MGRLGRCTITNRITEYFSEDDPRRELYAEVCDAGWQGMIENSLDIFFGECEKAGVEDFLFRKVSPN